MTSHRSFILAVSVFLLLSVSGWMIYSAVDTARTKFEAGNPPEDVKKALQPHTIDLGVMRPPALRPTDPTRFGSVTSSMSVFVYGDYECPGCRAMNPIITSAVSGYHGTVRLVWRDLPIASENPNAMSAAIFARCVGEQGKYWEAHDALMDAEKLGEGTYTTIAQQLKLNFQSLANCRQNPDVSKAIQQDIDESRTDGVDSAPFFFVGTEAIRGQITSEDLQKKIKLFLAS
jgi:protein-disulfide isomerase